MGGKPPLPVGHPFGNGFIKGPDLGIIRPCHLEQSDTPLIVGNGSRLGNIIER
jgi:hypothetical protein